MNLQDISKTRLKTQLIAGSVTKTSKEITDWMGAIQAQDYAMAKWALGVRSPGLTESDIDLAIDKGEILRTHVLRPTWHFVSGDNIYWMLGLTAPRIKAAMKSRDKQLGLDDTVYRKSNTIFENALTGGNHLTRDELMSKHASAGIITSDNRSSHLLMRAELDGLICSGKTKNNKLTYAILEERVPKTRSISHDEALVKLATLYFTSHGPATLKDFVWWSGLAAKDARHALEMVKQNLITETISNQAYWFTPSAADVPTDEESLYLLPSFDEFIISYTDRTSALHSDDHSKAVSSNGIFRPVIVVNGKIEGIWKRSLVKNKILIQLGFFQPAAGNNQKLLEQAIAAFSFFSNKETACTEMQVVKLK